ncbi:hypothetical protein HRG_009074 [Hirsutella rhossiliensis]|uniref:RNase MRP protein 1 RNA binding domain-containing protein n=1 Tax=Hirsutella rhossiliensis TaxID=111463 RepID=A0A9P8MQS6_9HYPO|nr:uncharacterized protein HRG_09074 [Hirsutella rhossiliensis]KAH0960053.1 hypothetical protein HRG_09074 [Hirsutella rhossiliensis]
MTLHQQHHHPRPPSSSRAPAADSLALLLPILHAFNHRHRNQHRASHWWASFGLLRRALGRLAHCLRPHVDATPPASGLVARARWLQSHVVPSAYVTFSQLAADNQHAPLGLLLLAVLARTHAVLAHLLPFDTPPALSLSAPTQPSMLAPSAAEPSAADHGVVVSRRELLQPEKPATSRPLHEDPVAVNTTKQSHDAKTVKGQAKSKAKKRSKIKDQDALSSLFSSLG